MDDADVRTIAAGPQLADPRRFARELVADGARAWDLGVALFLTGLRAQRRRTLLGHLWLILPPVIAALAASYVQTNGLVRVRETGMPYPLFAFAGTMFWQMFLEALAAPARLLALHRGVITRIRFPHEAVWVAALLEALVNAAIRLVLLGLLAGTMIASIGPAAWLVPFGVAGLLVLGLALGIALAPFALLWEDVSRGVLLAANFAIFLVPVFYPIRATGAQRLNPLLPLIDAPRAWLAGVDPAAAPTGAIAFAAAALVLAIPFYRLALPHVSSRLG